jgi:hypothetical protein
MGSVCYSSTLVSIQNKTESQPKSPGDLYDMKLLVIGRMADISDYNILRNLILNTYMLILFIWRTPSVPTAQKCWKREFCCYHDGYNEEYNLLGYKDL